jgi:hypothetical protein
MEQQLLIKQENAMKRLSVFLSLLVLMLMISTTFAQRGGGKIVLYKLFEEEYRQGGYDYVYPPASKVAIDKNVGYKSAKSLQFKLVGSDYSGVSICLYNEVFDLAAHRWSSTLEFMVKGAQGGEQVIIGLLDEDKSDDKKTQVKLPINKYIQDGVITTDWKQVQIPISEFIDRGMYYDQNKKTELPALIDWSKIAEFRVSADKGVNKKDPVIWVDNIQFVKSKPVPPRKEVYWDFIENTYTPPANVAEYKGGEKVLASVFSDDFQDGGFGYGYGGKTTSNIQKSSTKGNEKVLAMYFDDNDWSGVTFSMGSTVDLSAVRKTGGLYFWAKGYVGGESGWVGLMDDQGNEIQVQTKVSWNDWGNMTTEWSHFKVPLTKFLDMGLYWDAQKQTEVAKKFDWKKVKMVRFSVGKEFNAKRKNKEGAVGVIIDELVIVDKCDWNDPDVYWDSFASTAKDVLLHDFEKENNSLWEASHGPKSRVKVSVGPSKLDGKALIIEDYILADWVDAIADYTHKDKKYPHVVRDWTKHWGIMFDIYTEKPWQGITVQIADSGGELFIANTGAPKGRHTVLIPFRNFNKFPYYQPPHAVQNNNFDLDNINSLDFKPSGEGTRGDFQVDNVYLTNLKEIKKETGPAEAPFTIAGNFKNVITQSINPGIHGQNAALWDGDLLKKETIEQVKAIPHKVIRYPGGLRADDDHWEEVLANKDWMVDTDEFLDWLDAVDMEAMITVNFGKGTPEEAARWVEHVNIKRKANVKYWEIGNELYGNWHFSYDEYGADGGHAYGKRAAEFIKAMKAVDPTIQVTFVGVLEGEWNKTVLKYVADIADGINVHHYPQAYGQENDYALLAAPQSLPAIIGGVREALEKYGAKGKDYKIWLTEWNSVDFNPGPQIISLANGLFVADYLGMLAVTNIDIANYWDIHNSMTPEGGDYGYLTRTGDPLGDNVPRPSYWAFKMAAEALQGTLYKTETQNDLVSAYLTQNGKKKSLLLINKSKDTKFKTTLNIDGFEGKATIEILDSSNELSGPKPKSQNLKKGSVIEVPKFSVMKISIQ